jgi:16S rRNA (uracil1498-N3)-methyltransferase
MDISLRQAVELGVSCIQPVYSQYSVKAPDSKRADKRWAHWQSVVISACEQCGRASLPELAKASDLSSWISHTADPTGKNSSADDERDCLSFVLSPDAERSLRELLQEKQEKISGENPAITLLAGPESGFNPQEINLAVEHDMLEACLGPRVLRTETAGIAAIAVIQSLYGDL